MWSRGEHDKMLFRFLGQTADQMIPLLLRLRGPRRPRACMCLTHNNQFRALFDEDIAARVGFDKIHADNLIRVELVDAGIAVNLAVKAGTGIRADNYSINVELLTNLGLPLLAKVR